MKNYSKTKSANNADIKSQEKEAERWKATIPPQAEYLCETMDKMDFISAISSASIVVDYMGKYSDMRTIREAYAAINDIGFDETILPYRINVTLNVDYINSQPFGERYKTNVIYSIQMLVNSYVSKAAQFRVRPKEQGTKGFFKYLSDAIDVASQIVRNGYYKDDTQFKAKLKQEGLLELILEEDDVVTEKQIKNIVSTIKKEKQNILNKKNNAPEKKETIKNKNLH